MELIESYTRLNKLRVGQLIRISGTISGCAGAEGLMGIITDKPNNRGLWDHEDGVNVELFGTHYIKPIWRVNPSAIRELSERS